MLSTVDRLSFLAAGALVATLLWSLAWVLLGLRHDRALASRLARVEAQQVRLLGALERERAAREGIVVGREDPETTPRDFSPKGRG